MSFNEMQKERNSGFSKLEDSQDMSWKLFEKKF